MLKTEKLRIVHVIPSLKRGGAEGLVANICNKLSKREDIDCLLIALSEDNDYHEITRNVKVVNCNSKVVPSIFGKPNVNIDNYIKIITEFKPQIIHSHLFQAEILTRWHLFNNVCYVSHMHNNEKQLKNIEFKYLYKKKIITNLYEKWLIINRYKKCKNNFIAISNDVEQYLKKVLPLKFYKNIHLLHNAIDFSSFYHNKSIDEYVSEYRFITIGRMVEVKNQTFLIDVINEMHNKSIPAKLDIYGEGPARESLQKKIDKYKLNDFIILKGIVDKIQDILPQYSLYLHSATHEPFGLAILEAMASGLPVISLDGAGNRDIIEQGKNGYMVFDKSPEVFAEKAIELMKDEKTYKRMSSYANNFAFKFDIENYINELLVLYSKMLEIKKG